MPWIALHKGLVYSGCRVESLTHYAMMQLRIMTASRTSYPIVLQNEALELFRDAVIEAQIL